MPKILHEVNLSHGLVVACAHEATFDRVEYLGCMGTECADVTIFKNGFAVIFNAKAVRRIVNDFQIMPIGYVLNGFNFNRISKYMGCQNCLGVLGDHGFDGIRRYIEAIWINISEHQIAIFPSGCACCCHIRKRGRNDVFCNIERFQSDLNRDSPICHKSHILGVEEGHDLLF